MRNDLLLISYGSIVSITWFLAYWFVDSAWDIVYLDGVVHLICGAVVALAVLKLPKINPDEALFLVCVVIVFWEIIERAVFTPRTIADWLIMDTISDLMLGAIGGVIIIFDGFKFDAIKHQGD